MIVPSRLLRCACRKSLTLDNHLDITCEWWWTDVRAGATRNRANDNRPRSSGWRSDDNLTNEIIPLIHTPPLCCRSVFFFFSRRRRRPFRDSPLLPSAVTQSNSPDDERCIHWINIVRPRAHSWPSIHPPASFFVIYLVNEVPWQIHGFSISGGNSVIPYHLPATYPIFHSLYIPRWHAMLFIT